MSTKLAKDDFRRYGRQLILPGFGRTGQEKLLNASVCVVGAGGLGCPALQYLAAAGIGRIGIVDHDTISLSNLQRQILYRDTQIGELKVEAARSAIQAINAGLKVDLYPCALDASNSQDILSGYDILLDCTDNAPTRYLLSDTAVALGKPLVSGAALRFDGQLATYNLGDGPCYRCLYPKPAARATMGSCEENGILGPVVGTIGTLQALEAIKILSGLHDGAPTLLIFSALTVPSFRSIKLRRRKPDCVACGQNGKRRDLIDQSDYVAFCGGENPDYERLGKEPGDPAHRISGKELHDTLAGGAHHIIDVRPSIEFEICSLPNSTNIPLPELLANPEAFEPKDDQPLFVVCRLGNDSQIAAKTLREFRPQTTVKDLIGGLRAWSHEVDSSFPIY
ncbi:hypothetical protein SISNIDRAFT_455810 [Sistotremastrum niveocremeum HHB9708]|uniref:Needs CLA4 to survive protein 3 n=2 Tax=Sistotremastraceae TaxID=3402574 RepID=A0A164TRN7_9AGAM|nr:hypothetical protein SISNIDRAFT_455810 [Sistotremastrum niveocremeum HHB9708]KZT42248.1 hypothetical protein SISSUDRAFT_1041885 [Sistotremastrum suecicum HHB10207 ss-3]